MTRKEECIVIAAERFNKCGQNGDRCRYHGMLEERADSKHTQPSRLVLAIRLII